LRKECDDRRGKGQTEERHFFPKKRFELFQFMKVPTAQGPQIEQEQNEGKGYQHGLAHETKSKKAERKQIKPARCGSHIIPAPVHVFYISQDCQKEEQGAQEIFAFGNPCHGFHTKRMNREGSGYE
jgi:hypothetical protein